MSSVSPSLSAQAGSEEGFEEERRPFAAMSSPTEAASTSKLCDETIDSDHRSRLEQLKSHPFFGDLQVTLALDCLQSTVPYSLLTQSDDATKAKPHPAFCTVSDNIVEQHVNMQKTLGSLQMYFPSLIGHYHQMSDQIESQRYKALTYNCHSENVKRLINWFYDCERRLLIEKMQDSVSMLMDKTKSLISQPPSINCK